MAQVGNITQIGSIMGSGGGGGGGTPTGTPNTFAYFNPSGDLDSIPGWSIDSTLIPGSSTANLTYQPNNLSNYPQVFNFSVQIDPLQSSATDGLNVLSVNANLDVSANGFDFGNIALIQGGYNHGGNGSTYGNLAYLSFNSSFGNGTDPLTFKGFSYFYGFLNVSANVTVDGSLQGYGFQPNINAAAIVTGSFSVNAFYDNANIGTTVHGHNSFSANPNIAEVANNSSYQGLSIGPNITLFAGNAGFTGVGIYGNYTTLGTSGWQGVNMNPTIITQAANSGLGFINLGATITTMGTSGNVAGVNFFPIITTAHGSVNGFQANPQIAGGDADVTLFSGNLSNVTTSSTNLSVLQLSGATADGKYASASLDGVRFNVSGVLEAASSAGVLGQHILFTQYSTPDSTTITGTDIIMNILSPDVNMGDATSAVNMGPSGLGVNMVGFAGQIHGHGQMDQLSALVAGGIFLDDFTLPEWRGVNSLLINGGYSGVCTNATGFYHEVAGVGLFATNHWGVKIASDIDNSMYKLALNTATGKVSNASVGLEIGGTDRAFLLPGLTSAEEAALTALDGMLIYNAQTGKFRGYESGSWVNII
jgi:hypothetical protein